MRVEINYLLEMQIKFKMYAEKYTQRRMIR